MEFSRRITNSLDSALVQYLFDNSYSIINKSRVINDNGKKYANHPTKGKEQVIILAHGPKQFVEEQKKLIEENNRVLEEYNKQRKDCNEIALGQSKPEQGSTQVPDQSDRDGGYLDHTNEAERNLLPEDGRKAQSPSGSTKLLSENNYPEERSHPAPCNTNMEGGYLDHTNEEEGNLPPEDIRKAQSSSVRRALFPDCGKPTIGSSPLSDNSIGETVKVLEDRINMYTVERGNAKKAGQRNTARRKTKIIKELQSALESVKKGHHVDINKLLDFTPIKNNQKVQPVETPPSYPSPKAKTESMQIPSKRKQNFCLYCKKLVLKFAEHIEKKHPDTPPGQELLGILGTGNERRQKKTIITDVYRKQWNDIYNTTILDVRTTDEIKNKIITVKKLRNIDAPTVKCQHCNGLYRRDKLSVHLKTCKNVNNILEISEGIPIKAIRMHAKPILPTLGFVADAFKDDILSKTKVDDVMLSAMKDPLIMKFGNEFFKSRRAPSDKDYVLRVIRDITRLYLYMKEMEPQITNFSSILNPSYFSILTEAALKMAKYNYSTGNVEVKSIAYRLSQPLKDIAHLAKADAMANLYKRNDGDRSSVIMIDDFLDLINKNWKSSIGRICTKAIKIAKLNRTELMALESDIIKLAAYIESKYNSFLKEINSVENKKSLYDTLTHMVVVHIMLLVRRRPIDFKHASLTHYNNIDKHDELIEMAKGFDLTDENLNDCKRFHIFYVPGKNLEIVPIVLTQKMKQVVDTLIKLRGNVNINNEYLFTLSDNANIKPNESLRLIKTKVPDLRRPDHLTGNGLRHQAATFSRLHSTHPQFQDYLASTLGHTLAVHKKYYELPNGIIHKMLVCPILNQIMLGKSKPQPLLPSEPSTSTDQPLPLKSSQPSTSFSQPPELMETSPPQEFSSSTSEEEEDEEQQQSHQEWRRCKRVRWTSEEQEVVLLKFGEQILKKIIPSRREVKEFLQENPGILQNRTINQIVLFIRNHALRTQQNVTPKVKRILKRNSNAERTE